MCFSSRCSKSLCLHLLLVFLGHFTASGIYSHELIRRCSLTTWNVHHPLFSNPDLQLNSPHSSTETEKLNVKDGVKKCQALRFDAVVLHSCLEPLDFREKNDFPNSYFVPLCSKCPYHVEQKLNPSNTRNTVFHSCCTIISLKKLNSRSEKLFSNLNTSKFTHNTSAVHWIKCGKWWNRVK